MTDGGKGKNLPFNRQAIENATQQDRMSYARTLAGMIEASPLQQKEIAEAAGVTPRTIRNIVQGKVAPQADKLIALLLAVGCDIDDGEDEDVRPYTKMLAPVIRRIHPDYRAEAVSGAIGGLSDMVQAHPNVECTCRGR